MASHIQKTQYFGGAGPFLNNQVLSKILFCDPQPVCFTNYTCSLSLGLQLLLTGVYPNAFPQDRVSSFQDSDAFSLQRLQTIPLIRIY